MHLANELPNCLQLLWSFQHALFRLEIKLASRFYANMHSNSIVHMRTMKRGSELAYSWFDDTLGKVTLLGYVIYLNLFTNYVVIKSGKRIQIVLFAE